MSISPFTNNKIAQLVLNSIFRLDIIGEHENEMLKISHVGIIYVLRFVISDFKIILYVFIF